MKTREKILVAGMIVALIYGGGELIGSARSTKKAQSKDQSLFIDNFQTIKSGLKKAQLTQEEEFLMKQAKVKDLKDPFVKGLTPDEWKLKQKLIAQAKAKENRTRKLSVPGSSKNKNIKDKPHTPKFRYTGHLQKEDSQIAIIDGIEYAVGETLVDNYKIKISHISMDKVILTVSPNGDEVVVEFTKQK